MHWFLELQHWKLKVTDPYKNLPIDFVTSNPKGNKPLTNREKILVLQALMQMETADPKIDRRIVDMSTHPGGNLRSLYIRDPGQFRKEVEVFSEIEKADTPKKIIDDVVGMINRTFLSLPTAEAIKVWQEEAGALCAEVLEGY